MGYRFYGKEMILRTLKNEAPFKNFNQKEYEKVCDHVIGFV